MTVIRFFQITPISSSVPPENIPCINLLPHVVEAGIVAVGDDGLNQVLRNVRAIRKELLRVLLETVAAIACVGYSNANTSHIQQLTYSCTSFHNTSGSLRM